MDVIFDKRTVFIDLQQGYKNISNNYQRTTKKQIKRAEKRHNIYVEYYENNLEFVELFLVIYNDTMDRVNAEKYLYFSREYFEMLFSLNSVVCFIAFIDNNPIAAILAFYNGFFIHGHLGGAKSQWIKLSPFSLLYDHLIRFGIEKSCKFLHVGGGRSNANDDALLNFKLNFSSSMAEFYIGKKIHNYKVYNNIIARWEDKYPDKTTKYRNYLLKYRY